MHILMIGPAMQGPSLCSHFSFQYYPLIFLILCFDKPPAPARSLRWPSGFASELSLHLTSLLQTGSIHNIESCNAGGKKIIECSMSASPADEISRCSDHSSSSWQIPTTLRSLCTIDPSETMKVYRICMQANLSLWLHERVRGLFSLSLFVIMLHLA